MNEDEFLQLVEEKKRKKANLCRCIVCQKDKPTESLTSTENGRSNILSASKLLKDDLLADLDAEEVKSIQYHLKACYKSYILRSKRAESLQETDSKADEGKDFEEDGNKLKPPGRSKHRKTEEGKKPCIICNHVMFNGDGNLYRICEEKRAKLCFCVQ